MKVFTIRQKLITAMAVGLFFTCMIGFLAHRTGLMIVSNSDSAVIKLKEINVLKSKGMLHLIWMDNLHDLILFDRPFAGPQDINKCGFSLWYDSYVQSGEFAGSPLEYQAIIRQIGDKHEELHRLAQEAVFFYTSDLRQEAEELYRQRIMAGQLEFGELIGQAENYLDQKAEAALLEAEKTKEAGKQTIRIIVIAAICFALGMSWLLMQATSKPLTRLIKRLREINKSSMDGYQKVEGFRSGDEVGELVATFNTMIERINAQQAELKDQNEELAAQNEEITAQQEELTAQNEEIRAQQEELEEALIKLSRQDETLTRLYGFSQLLTKTIELDKLLAVVLEGLFELTKAETGCIYLYDKETGELRQKAAQGLIPSAPSSLRIGDGLAGRAAWQRKAIVTGYNEGQLHSQSIRGELKMASEIYLPLVFHEELLGVIALGKLQGVFDTENQKVLVTLTDQLAVAIKNALSHLDIRQALKHVQGVNRLKSELINTVSHELRTPLASILGFAELLLKKPPGEAKGKKYLETIYNEAVRLTGLINNFLDLQRIETGRLEFNHTSIKLDKLIEDCVKLYQGQSSRHRFMMEVENDLPDVWADRDRLVQVLGNLLSNAVKYSPVGGTIEVRARRGSARQVFISVRDQGLGIPDEAKDKLFQPFFRVDNSDRRQIGGTGLGLVICKKIVEAMGGEIWVESKHGQGSIFTFSLPVSGESPKQDISTRKNVSGIPRGEVLIIEDDYAMAELVGEALNCAGLATRTATNGAEALEMIAAAKPGIIILDLILPGVLDGWEILRKLKQNPATRDIPVIISSSLDRKEQGYSLGTADYLVKPFSPEKLLESVETVLGKAAGVIGVPTEDRHPDQDEIGNLLVHKGFKIREIKKEGSLLIVTLDTRDVEERKVENAGQRRV